MSSERLIEQQTQMHLKSEIRDVQSPNNDSDNNSRQQQQQQQQQQMPTQTSNSVANSNESTVSAVPITVTAFTTDTPHLLQPMATATKTDSTQYHNQQQQQQPQRRQQPTLQHQQKKIASVPTSMLAPKSVITLSSMYMQDHDDKKVVRDKNISSPTTKRGSPDAEKQMKCKNAKIKCQQETMKVPQQQLPTNISSLQSYFNNLLESRGYSTNNYSSLETAYSNKPSPLQIASHGVKVIEAVRKSDLYTIRTFLNNGLSPNPCNKFGESIIHMICRRGDYELLKLFMEFGCNLQICDDFGRTPLHDACWTSVPNFDIIELILEYDRRLMNILDCRGSSPLNYVKRDHWSLWIAFFDRVKEKFWSKRDVNVVGEESPPDLVCKSPNSTPLSVTSLCSKAIVENIERLAMGTVLSKSSSVDISNNVVTISKKASIIAIGSEHGSPVIAVD